jgi:2-polyprenyl-6-methoxyphenol hydroxylase-like FAD-dependent oxidoreductase
MRVLIAGAGIGGLAAAIALRQAGIAAEVYERAPALLEVGAGISLWPNAVKVLDRLGIGELIRAASVASYAGGIHDWRGRMLAAADSEDMPRAFGAPMLILHRADLLNVLHQAAGAAHVHLGLSVQGFNHDTAGVTLQLSDGRAVPGDVLIGADGIRSTVRTQLFPNVKPRFAGQATWRGITRFDAPAGASFWGESWGAGARFGLLPIAGERVYWFAVRNAAASTSGPPVAHKQELQRLFGAWHAPIPQLIAATDDNAILHNDIYDLPPLPTWTRGPVTLLGDAAHATTPNLGQGGCQAIEDAVVLARMLRENADIATALVAYESQRISRANMITELSRRVGVMGNWTHPAACWLRNTLTAAAPRWARLRMLRPIVGYEA